jgi:hypothetical protein
MTEKSAFLQLWQSRYPQTPSVSHLFKQRLTDRWARIHSLPKAKRYADTKAEWDILLHRQTTVMSDLLGDVTQVRMVLNSYTASHPLPKMKPVAYLGDFADETDPESGERVHAHLVTVGLDGKSLTPLLKLVADDRLRAFFVGGNCLIAPYDGGMDVILENAAVCREFKPKYAEWLSERADGL